MTPAETAPWSSWTMGAEALHLLRWGEDGPPILLTHGLASNASWWLKTGAELGARFRTVALDFAGHGDSAWRSAPYGPETYAADIEEARHSLGWEKMILVGHSMGARVAAEYAARRPERLAGLVLVDFWPERYDRSLLGRPSHSPIEGRHSGATAPLADKLKAKGQPVYPDPEAMAARFHLEPRETALSASELQALGRLCLKKHAGGYTWKFDWRAFDAAFEAVWPAARAIKMPSLLVRGEKSTVMTREAFARLAKELSGSRAVEVPGAHHHVPLDAPGALARLIADFASRVT